jgi:gliding motility-associated lipoprotein GldB
MKRILGLILILIGCISCADKLEKDIDISSISITLQLDRFETEFYRADSTSLADLKAGYPFLFPEFEHDSVWYGRIADPTEQELFRKTDSVFGTMDRETQALTDLFRRVTYYNPGFRVPRVITLISNRDYQSRVMYADSLLFVSLDLYLGKDDVMYAEFPDYLARQFEPYRLPVDVAMALAERQIPYSRHRIFLSSMIEEGKKLVLAEHYVSEATDAELMAYAPEALEWVEANEIEIWKYFVDRNLLFSTNPELRSRFLDDGPFSKFYLDIDKESPGRVGVWMGWQIVRAFMRNTESDLRTMINTEPEDLFNKSKYKPRK